MMGCSWEEESAGSGLIPSTSGVRSANSPACTLQQHQSYPPACLRRLLLLLLLRHRTRITLPPLLASSRESRKEPRRSLAVAPLDRCVVVRKRGQMARGEGQQAAHQPSPPQRVADDVRLPVVRCWGLWVFGATGERGAWGLLWW